MTAATLVWLVPATLGVVCLAYGAVMLLRHFDRRASQAINAQIDQALLGGPDWIATDEQAYANCLDCAQDQAIGVTKDGSHDSLVLDANEETAWQEIEFRLEGTQ